VRRQGRPTTVGHAVAADKEDVMAGKTKAPPKEIRPATEAEKAAADAVRSARQAARMAKAAASQAKGVIRKGDKGLQADRRKNAFGIAASASKATAVSRAIVSRSRGARGR
jgi:hypothetical protein